MRGHGPRRQATGSSKCGPPLFAVHYRCPVRQSPSDEQLGSSARFAVFFPSFSTWTGSGLFLEDLFVRETFRGHGVGKALLCQVAEIARKEGHHTIRLDVLDWNESAIKFYKSFGAEYLLQLRNVVIGENALGRLGRR